MVDGPRGFGRSMGMSQPGSQSLAGPIEAIRALERIARSAEPNLADEPADKPARSQGQDDPPALPTDVQAAIERCGAPERHTGPIASPPRSHPYRSSKGRACPGEPPRRLPQRGKPQSRGTFRHEPAGGLPHRGGPPQAPSSAGRTSKALASTRRISKAPTTTQAHSGPRASIRTAPGGGASGR